MALNLAGALGLHGLFFLFFLCLFNQGGLYHDNETELEEALFGVITKLAPASVGVIQGYPYATRQDRYGKRVSSPTFDYRRAYRRAVDRVCLSLSLSPPLASLLLACKWGVSS